MTASTGILDLVGVSYLGSGTTLNYSSTGTNIGTLTVSDGGSPVASITLLGNYIAGTGNFAAQSDGHGGTIATDPQVVQASTGRQSLHRRRNPRDHTNPHAASSYY